MKRQEVISMLTSKIKNIKGYNSWSPTERDMAVNQLRFAINLVKDMEFELREYEVWKFIAEKYNQDEVYWEDAKNHYLNSFKEPDDLPVVPQFVDDWLSERKKDFKTAYEAMLYIQKFGWDDETHIEYKMFKWIPDNAEVFFKAWKEGYTIEPSKWVVYYVSDKDKCFIDFKGINGYTCGSREKAIKFNDEKRAQAVALLTDGMVDEY